MPAKVSWFDDNISEIDKEKNEQDDKLEQLGLYNNTHHLKKDSVNSEPFIDSA